MYMPRTGSLISRSDIKMASLALDIPMGSPDTSVHYDPVSAAISVGGSLIAGSMARKSGNQAADAQLQASRDAARLQAFRPVDITSRFGSGQFETEIDPATGAPVLKGASYTVAPEMKAIQDRIAAMYGTSLGQYEGMVGATQPLAQGAQGLFGLGQQYLAKSPEQAAQDYYNQQYALMEPGRQREEQRLGASVFGRGRAGLNISGQGQPELFALGKARAEQDAALAAQAEQAAQQRISFGAGLFGAGSDLYGQQLGLQTQAFSPFQTQLGAVQTIEELAQQPLQMGAAFGSQQAAAGANMGQSILQGGMAAANTRLQGQMVLPTLLGQSASAIGQGYFMKQNPTLFQR